MDGSALSPYFQFEYKKLHFEVQMTEKCVLPKYKTSALRGGMGEMLLRENCIRDRNCSDCSLEEECIVRRIMYSQMRIQPAFMSDGDSVGYVIHCEDRAEEFQEGDTLSFYVLLFGRMAAYTGQIIRAFKQLGENGLGRDKAQFAVKNVSECEDTLENYVGFRKQRFLKQTLLRQSAAGSVDSIEKVKLRFRTPVAVKYRKEMLCSFDTAALLQAVERRLYMLNCYEGIPVERIQTDEHVPLLIRQQAVPVGVKRYSSRHGKNMWLNGILGEVILEAPDEVALELLLAGELVHIGKNTSFGFGKYTVHISAEPTEE
ncbi:MAG: CRISPR system precrRNA processing endoribonuclease RAMP protein Cas6 [Lachnospiraceae bacterium]|nr:CRISPR system precrRNA processing endoribonuclease RAMP protein Cas6 [Lachnospiraceae bacterium]